MVSLGPQVLMEVVTAEARSSAGEGSPLKIALFSLGNMCAHPVCAEVLLSLGAREPLTRLGRSPDSTIQRYVQRIQVELSQIIPTLRGMMNNI